MSDMRTLRPGLLVSLNTSIRGNVSYYKNQLEGAHIGDSGEERSRWETTRVVFDPAEQEAASKVRNKAGSLIRGVCAQSAFGLLCPEDRADELLARVAEARQLAQEFNDAADLTRVTVHVIYGRIAQDDVAAVQAISAELRDLMQDMQMGLEKLDVDAVRKACDKARSVGQMLSPEAKSRVQYAIDAARKSARKIVKAGELIGAEIDRSAIAKIGAARTTFLELDDADETVVAMPEMTGRAFELAPADEGIPVIGGGTQFLPAFDLGA